MHGSCPWRTQERDEETDQCDGPYDQAGTDSERGWVVIYEMMFRGGGMKMWVWRSIATVFLLLAMPMLAHGNSSVFVVDHFRWRNDDGTAGTATWKAAADSSITNVPHYEKVRLRFSISDRDETGSIFIQQNLMFAASTNGPWIRVGAPSSGSGVCPFEFVDSSWFTNGASAGNHLAGTGTFNDGGRMVDARSVLFDVSIDACPGGEYVNTELCVRPTVKAKGGTKYYFRLGGIPYEGAHASMTLEAYDPPEPPVIVSSLSATVQVESAAANERTYKIDTAGSEPIAYEVEGMPAGFALFNDTIADDGSPSVPGTYNVTITASNAYGIDTKIMSLTVPGSQVAVIRSVVYGEVGKPLNYVVSAAGTAPVNFGAEVMGGVGYQQALPAGLAFTTEGTKGTLGGVPQEAAVCRLQITASNSTGRATTLVLLRITDEGAGLDSDADGIPNSWELEHFGGATAADPAADPDMDGASNLSEYIGRTDPNDVQSVFQIETITVVPLPTLTFDSKTSRMYTVETRAGLEDSGPWQTLLGNITGTGGRLEVADGEEDDHRVYRIRVGLR